MFLVQNWPFFQMFFLGNIVQENVFLRDSRTKKRLDDILKRKNTFPGYNNKKSKKSKNLHFSKGVNLWF